MMSLKKAFEIQSLLMSMWIKYEIDRSFVIRLIDRSFVIRFLW